MRVTLTVEAGPHQGEVFSFSGHEMFLVGRSKRCHFQLDKKDMYLSRVHFMIEVNPPLCRLSDMGSRGGTLVNNRKVDVVELRDGDLIRAGHTTVRVAIVPTVESTHEPDPRDVDVLRPLTVIPVIPSPPPLPLANCPACGMPGPLVDYLCVNCRRLAETQPQFLPGYWLLRELGRGGMGSVTLAVRRADGWPSAVKMVLPAVSGDVNKMQRFLREADVLRQLAHPNIVACREVGEVEGRLFFAMEFVRGTDLSQALRKQGLYTVPQAVRIVSQVLVALAHAHLRGFVHRDIKPANILLAEEDGRVKVADFGLARVYQASQLSGLTIGGDIGGTPGYLPPEQITHFRDVSPAADQYSTSAMLYHLITGKYIFDFENAKGMAAIVKVLEEEPIPLRIRRPDFSPQLEAVIHRALAHDPQERYPDVQTFCQALAPFGR